jgi:hypothetical protein
MEQEIIDTASKQKVQKHAVLVKVILLYNAMCLISTLIYWIYFEYVTQRLITPIHFKFRWFIFENYVREIILLSLSLGILYALFRALMNRKYRLLLITTVVLVLEIVLFSQLHISKGP